MKSPKKTKEQQPQPNDEFEQFEFLTKNLISVSNAEVREKMKKEKENFIVKEEDFIL